MTELTGGTETDGSREDRSISMAQANLYGVLVILPTLLLVVPYALVWGLPALLSGLLRFGALLPFLVALVLGILAHEAIHVVAWKLAGGVPWSAVRVGFQLKTLTPYAHCAVPLEVRTYRIGAAAPGVVLGVLPVALATASGDGWLLWFGVLFSLAASGDLIILWTLRDVPAGRLVTDHPTRAGCYVLAPGA